MYYFRKFLLVEFYQVNNINTDFAINLAIFPKLANVFCVIQPSIFAVLLIEIRLLPSHRNQAIGALSSLMIIFQRVDSPTSEKDKGFKMREGLASFLLYIPKEKREKLQWKIT